MASLETLSLHLGVMSEMRLRNYGDHTSKEVKPVAFGLTFLFHSSLLHFVGICRDRPDSPHGDRDLPFAVGVGK